MIFGDPVRNGALFQVSRYRTITRTPGQHDPYDSRCTLEHLHRGTHHAPCHSDSPLSSLTKTIESPSPQNKSGLPINLESPAAEAIPDTLRAKNEPEKALERNTLEPRNKAL